jgi:4-hydroxybenzoate polyprenyltransferase/phosphoserine phosphatase
LSRLPPLVIDLDGTLLRSDLLVESGLAFVRMQPASVLSPLKWLISGKAHLKEQLAKASEIDVTRLPYDTQVMAFIEQERATGREIVLATASHKIYADQIAAHLKLFDRVMATDGTTNLSATRKRDRLVAEFGEQGFDYAGNSRDDLSVWAAARKAYVVNPESGVEKSARALGNVERVITAPNRGRLITWAKALRLHQWIKNLLIVVPLLASHKLNQPELVGNGLLAFLFFGLCASSVYMLNDLLDLADDRHHPTKRNRPFASGVLPVKSALFIFPLLLIASFAGAATLLPPRFTAALACYYLLTLAYSLSLKRVMVVDVITLAALYTLRIIAGTFAFKVSLTFWMLAFSMFTFLSLALVKRFAELREARANGKTEKARGRGYYPDDLNMISSLGASSGYLSVLVLALYIQDQATAALYARPHVIWLACPLLLFWFSRTWLLTHRGEMHDDPVVFAIKDRTSLLVGALFAAIFWLAT